MNYYYNFNYLRGETEQCRFDTTISNYITIKDNFAIKGQNLGIISDVTSKDKGVVSIATKSGESLELKVTFLFYYYYYYYIICKTID